MEETQAHPSQEPLLPYYVYVLLDPSKSPKEKTFYVGKGTGNRVGHHFEDAKRKISNESNEEVTENEKTKKRQIIEYLINSGRKPLEIVIGRYETEEEAYAVEAVLIHFMFGHENLTNIASGHGSKLLRSKKDFDNILENAEHQHDIETKPGIDIERTVGVRDGTFKNQKIQGLAAAGAYEFLSVVKDKLTEAKFTWRDFTAQPDRRFHPGESNGYLAVILRIGAIDLNIQFTAGLQIKIQVIWTESSKSATAKDQLEKIKVKLGATLSEPKAEDKYSWVEPKEDFCFTDVHSLIAKLHELQNTI